MVSEVEITYGQPLQDMSVRCYNMQLIVERSSKIRLRKNEYVGEEYLGIVGLACTEQSFQRIVAWNEETGKVHKKLSSNVEEYQEEVDSGKAEEGINFGDGRLLLEVVEHRVFGQL